ncbi:MAG: hypothetical protein IJ195_08860 [Lachnospiraceae bacterium]|nr:hypothetical protein [Lachnospiraceae bacterium]
MNNMLRASWRKSYKTVQELFEAKDLVEKETKGISDEVVIIPLSKLELLVTVWITTNIEYWDKKLTRIMGEKEDYSEENFGYTDISDEEYWNDVEYDNSIH